MDGAASLRLKDAEITKLKAARANDATRLKAAALKNRNKALADQKRAHSECIAELRKEVASLKASDARKTEEISRLEQIDRLEKANSTLEQTRQSAE